MRDLAAGKLRGPRRPATAPTKPAAVSGNRLGRPRCDGRRGQRAPTGWACAAADALSTERTNCSTDAPSGESALVNMNGAPELRALIAPRYSLTTWWSMLRRRAPSAFFTLMPVNAFERLRTSWTFSGP